MKNKKTFVRRLCFPRIIVGAILCLALICLTLSARAYVHPCIPVTSQDLATIKASLNQQPWKQGYKVLAADGHSQLTYTMQGPFGTVTRNPNLNLGQWDNDMQAVYNLACMWYFTTNTAYAQKAHDILISWANTQTNFGGQESGLELGDYAGRYAGGADILRSTWPGWTAADTATVQNYFLNVFWTATSAPGNTPGEFNKGLLNMEAGIAIAAFCDDTNKFNHVVDTYRTYPAAGPFNTLPTGETGETGRDSGHVYGGMLGAAFISECAWKQGMDLYADLDNRLLAWGEYYARNTLFLDNPFVPYGTVDYTYYANAAGPYAANRAALYLIQNAYKNRKGLPTPWIDQKLQDQSVDYVNWMYAKTADFTTATPQAAIVRPSVSVASSGLTLTTLGSNSAGRSASYANGVWTVTGAGVDIWNDVNDDCQFVYQAMTGDCALVAQVTSSQWINNSTKAGLMIRDNLSATVSQRAWIVIMPTPTNQVECRQKGWTETWGGQGWAVRDNNLPPGMPYWLKIERRGQLITTYSSPDGTSWAPIISSYYGNLGATTYIGLCIVSGSSTTTTTATFANVAFTGGSGGLVTTPAAPAAVFADGSSQAITVSWLPSFGATSYNLLRSTTSGSGYAAIASNLSASTTSYVDTTAAAGTTYYYVVQAVNSAGTSGNSPEFYGSRITSPMVNLAFGGTTLANTNVGSGVGQSDDGFNGDPGSKWYGFSAPTGWLQYDFGANNAQVVKRYTINSADVPARDPKDWTFLGSQDGINWTTLDSQIGQLFAIPLAQNTYNIGNTTAYRYYQINITANNGATGVAIGDLGLWGDSGHTIPDGRYQIVNRRSNKVIDVSGGSTANGAQLVQWTYGGGNSQQWDVAWQGNGQYRATGVASGKVIDNGGTSNAGANLAIQTWNGGTSQLWNIVPDSDGFFHITSVNSGLVADVSGGSTADGASIIQWAYSGSGNQQWMPSLASATSQPQVPLAPTGLTATAASSSQINLSWTASSGATSYNVKRATVSGGPYTTVATGVTVTSYSDTGLSASTTYYYVVSAVNSSGESANSAEANATTLSAVPATPTGLAATAGNNQVALSWTASTGATSYNVKRATTSGGPYTTIASPTTASYTDTTAVNGTTYYYVVSAVNTSGESANSSQVSATPQPPIPPVPTGLTATAGNNQVALSWTASSGATSYNVKRATTSGGPYTTIASPTTASYTDTMAVNGTTYYYVVSAVNTSGESANSTQVSATPSGGGLPAPWLTQDIGAVGIAGSAVYSNSIYTVTGSGADTWGNSDQFRYVYQTGGTNCSITAQVLSVSTNSSAAAKAGVMMRNTLTTNSMMCEMQITALNGAENLWRTTTGGNVTGKATSGLHAPYWVRMTRAGSTFTSYRSPDGVTWTAMSTNTITMTNSVYIGLYVCSHNNSALCTATFTNVVASP